MDARTEREQPGSPGKRTSGAMMLEPVAARIAIGVAAEIRHDQHRGIVLVLRIGLYELPERGAETIRPLDSVHIEREGARVGDIHVVERQQYERRGDDAH